MLNFNRFLSCSLGIFLLIGLALGCRSINPGDSLLSKSMNQPPIVTDVDEPLGSASDGVGDSPAGVNITLGDAPAAVGWTDNYVQALERASSEGRLVLAFFTGSDFCQPCMRLRQEVVETPEFQSWANERFVLLELDYPRRTPQHPDLAEQNRELLEAYGVSSFPTVLVLNSSGQVVAKAAYRPGGSTPWIQAVEQQLTQTR